MSSDTKAPGAICGSPECTSPNDDLWVFGYGSMVWRADFPFVCKHRGFIEGFERKFYQNSIDHRGTADKPGRVVTLIRGPDEAKTYGMAYRIAAAEKATVLEHLDYREINGYDRLMVDFHLLSDDDEVIGKQKALLYIATTENPSFAGSEDSYEKIAQQVCSSAGKSGKNADYVFRLADSMRTLYPKVEDTHLTELEKAVRRLLSGTLSQG